MIAFLAKVFLLFLIIVEICHAATKTKCEVVKALRDEGAPDSDLRNCEYPCNIFFKSVLLAHLERSSIILKFYQNVSLGKLFGRIRNWVMWVKNGVTMTKSRKNIVNTVEAKFSI